MANRDKEAGRAAERAVARLARRDADRLSFWRMTCEGAMEKSGRDLKMCEVISRAENQLRGLASCLADRDCIAVADAAAPEKP